MTQSNSNNVVYLQTTLRNLEERYKKLQNRVESLQVENERLVTSRTELVVEVERLQDQQIRLRERNLRLTQEFHSKQQECSLLAEKLTMFARGRVGNYKVDSESFKSDLTELKEDLEGSRDSLVTVELHGNSDTRPKVLDVTSRTYSEPNLSVIQRELDLVRKGLWSPALENTKGTVVEDLSSKLLLSLKKGQGELEEQCSRMMEFQRNSMEAVQGLSILSDENDETDPMEYVQQCTQSALALKEKLQNENFKLRHLHQILRMNAANEAAAASVVTQTSFDMHAPELGSSSVWKNMNLQDRICPLCENIFSTVISQDEFVDHVMSHFEGDGHMPEFEILSLNT
ncbi:uncharacterized protein LOC130695842 [Daphnia carinata]|uniref:uncharacterized protein LOC130695842 n=1 Tax=Daphnia carinata TaxID=120202 RepID=UPI00257C9505|nr:uncharacterized protein LOC130695842 [Daphnia carinata]